MTQRSIRRPVLVVTASFLLAAAVLTFASPPVTAAQLQDVGWWWKANTGQQIEPPGPSPVVGLPQPAPAPPAPPTVPEGGLLVSRDAEGATAIAAVRFTLLESETNPVLTLTVSNSSENAGRADIIACESGSAWTGEHGGRWDSKPLVECDLTGGGGGSVSGVPSDDGTTWTFALSPLLIDGPGGKEIDVVLVPSRDPEAPAGAQEPFQVTFEPVDDKSLETQQELEFPSGGSFGSGSFEGGGFDPGGSFGAGSSPSGGSFGPPPTGSLDSGSSFDPSGNGGLASPALPEEDQGLSATAPRTRNRTTPALAAPAEPAGDDAGPIAVGLLLAGGAFAYWAAKQGTPQARSLSRFAGAGGAAVPAGSDAGAPADAGNLGGLGRFVRPRSGPPPSLT